MTEKELSLWTIHDALPGLAANYVAHRWKVKDGVVVPTPDLIVAASLEALRERVRARGMTMAVRRAPLDAEKVIETWV